MKQKKKQTMLEKKIKYGSPAAYYRSKCHKAAVQLNNELNKADVQLNNELNEAAESIQKNTKDLALEFSRAVDNHFWELV